MAVSETMDAAGQLRDLRNSCGCFVATFSDEAAWKTIHVTEEQQYEIFKESPVQ